MLARSALLRCERERRSRGGDGERDIDRRAGDGASRCARFRSGLRVRLLPPLVLARLLLSRGRRLSLRLRERLRLRGSARLARECRLRLLLRERLRLRASRVLSRSRLRSPVLAPFPVLLPVPLLLVALGLLCPRSWLRLRLRLRLRAGGLRLRL